MDKAEIPFHFLMRKTGFYFKACLLLMFTGENEKQYSVFERFFCFCYFFCQVTVKALVNRFNLNLP